VLEVRQSESKRCLSSLCLLLGYSRQAYYQYHRRMCEQALEIELVVKEVVQIRKLQPRIGARKLQVMLQEFLMRNQIKMGRDALFDVLSYHGLLIRRRRRKPITTFSGHWFKKYDNLIEGFYPVAPGQLWVSDITYIEVGSAFAYLSL